MRNKLIVIPLLILGFLKAIIWWATVPVWQAPDEQAHFAQLEWYGEKKTFVIPEKNLSAEVALSETLLGTRRDPFGNNRYTYHPQFNINYAQSLVGEWEKLINNQPKSARTEIVGSEAAMYPPLYYILALPFYNSVYDHGLIDRVFAIRLLSVILNLLLVLCAYAIGKVLWDKGPFPLVLAGLVAFHPMVSFVASGFHPDNLLNLLYSTGILISLLILKKGIRLHYLFWLGVIFFLGFETKPLMLLLVPVAAAVIVSRKSLILALLVLIAPIFLFFMPFSISFVPHPSSGISFLEYLRFRLPKTFFEIWPWYWGVFKWLGVTLPPLSLKVITRVAILATIGLAVKFIHDHKNNLANRAIIFFLVSSLSYFVYLVIWDWRLIQVNNFSAGLQGRYFFPNIVPHLALLLLGLTGLAPSQFKNQVAVVVLFGMVVLNAIAWQTVAKSYYDLSSPKTFFTQVSQYKPEIVKWFGRIEL